MSSSLTCTSVKSFTYFLIKCGLSLLLLVQVQCERDFEINLQKLTCKNHDPTILAIVWCDVEQIKNRTYGRGLFVVRESIQNLPVRLRLVAFQSNGKRWNYFDLKLDLCHILSAVDKHRIFRQTHKEIKRAFGEMPICPIKANHNYSMRNYYFDPDDYPTSAPAGKYRLEVNFFLKENQVCDLIFDVNLVYRRKIVKIKKT